MSAASSGRRLTEEHKAAIGNGRRVTEEHKHKAAVGVATGKYSEVHLARKLSRHLFIDASQLPAELSS